MNVLNILWAFNISPVAGDERDPLLPITIDDFSPVRYSIIDQKFKTADTDHHCLYRVSR